MATVNGLTKERMLVIEAASVVSGEVNEDGDLILTKHDASEINAGHVVGPAGSDATVPDASDTVKGKVELATSAEVATGTDTGRVITPAGLASMVTTNATPNKLVKTDGSGRIKAVAGAETSDVPTMSQLTRPNICINPTGRTNQRGYVSGTYCAPGIFTLDRWKANGTIAYNYISNPSGETNTTGYVAVPSTTGVAAITSAAPSTTTAFGTKVLKCTWSTANTAAGGGMYYEIDVATSGFVVGDLISAAFYHAKSSLANLMRMEMEFRTNSANISTVIASQKLTTAGTIYTAASNSEFKIENQTIPATCTKIRLHWRAINGTGYVNQSIGSYIELDGLMANRGATVYSYFDGATADVTDYLYDWISTANGSASFKMSLTAITFTAAPQGQTVTVSTAGIWAQIVARENIKAQTYTMSWPGTALGRVYKIGTSAPALAASPIVVSLDGTGDVIMEFTAGTVIVNDVGVNLEPGAVAHRFELESVAIELYKCKTYFQPLESGANEYFAFGQAYSTTLGFGLIRFPVPMRTAPTVTRTAATDFATFTASGADAVLSALTFQEATTRSVRYNATCAAVLTVGQAMQMHGITTNARIYADSEI